MEGYPDNWKHCMIHLNPETGEMNSDGDHSVRKWIEGQIGKNKVSQLEPQVSKGAVQPVQVDEAIKSLIAKYAPQISKQYSNTENDLAMYHEQIGENYQRKLFCDDLDKLLKQLAC